MCGPPLLLSLWSTNGLTQPPWNGSWTQTPGGMPSACGKVPKYESNVRFSWRITMTCLILWIPDGADAAGPPDGARCACTSAPSPRVATRAAMEPAANTRRSLIPLSRLSRKGSVHWPGRSWSHGQDDGKKPNSRCWEMPVKRLYAAETLAELLLRTRRGSRAVTAAAPGNRAGPGPGAVDIHQPFTYSTP